MSDGTPFLRVAADRIGAPGSARIAGNNAIPRHQSRHLVLNHPDRREDGRHSKANCTSSSVEPHSTGLGGFHMGNPGFEVDSMAVSGLQQFLYKASQAARTSWFWSHNEIAARLAAPNWALPNQRLPTQREIMADLRDLFECDWQNISDGYYGLPHDLMPRPSRGFGQSLRFFNDLASVNRRRQSGANQEVFDGPYRDKRPRYYLQNFHDQSGGYLSASSAQLYDYQVEVLFSGGADAMRRQALPPITQYLRARNVRSCRLLDVACGTGRFLSFVKDAHPRLSVTGLDMSGEYLAKATDNLRPWSRAECVLGNAEAMPILDSLYNIVTWPISIPRSAGTGSPSHRAGNRTGCAPRRPSSLPGFDPAGRRAIV